MFVGGSEIMSVQPFVLRPDQHEPALNVVGTLVTVLASNAATLMFHTQVLYRGPAGVRSSQLQLIETEAGMA
jgi:hypothetical protein